MEKEFTTEYCKYQFNQDEKKELSEEMAQKVVELAQLEDDRKAVASDFKGRIDGVKAQINSAATKLNNGYEMRQIKCEVTRDYTLKKIFIVRTDNDETVREKDMNSDDLQRKIEEV